MTAVVNQWVITDMDNYGIASVPVASTPGNTLVAFIGWNSALSALNPVSNVADDANDWWTQLTTTNVAGNVRCSIWIAPNTRPGYGSAGGASVVSLAFSWFVQGMCGLVVEFSGMPQFTENDFAVQTFFSNTGTSGFTFSRTATVPDIAFSLIASGNNASAVTPPGAPWNALSTVAINDPSGPGGPGDISISPIWYAPGAGAVNAAWTWTANTPVAGFLVGIKQAPALPASSSFYWPKFKAEAAFGYQPGDPSTVPAYTDISPYAIGPLGQAWGKASRGKEYEINQAEAGITQLALNNQTGAFIPGNVSSPFYPNILEQTPLRFSAFWDNRQYGIGTGFVERWPQEFPMPQWGYVPVSATDAVSVLSNAVQMSAVAGDVVTDAPYAYFRFNESYTNASGLPLANSSRTNQRPAIAINGEVRTGTGSWPVGTGNTIFPVATGAALGIPGDQNAGIGHGGTPTSIVGGPGAIYYDPGLPQPGALPGAVTYEFWAVIPPGIGANPQTLLQVQGATGNYFSNTERLLFGHNGSGIFGMTVSDTGGTTSGWVFALAATDGLPHHYAFQVWTSGGNYRINFYFDGVLQGGTKISTGTLINSDWITLIAGPPNTTRSGSAFPQSWNYAIGHLAVYGYQLPLSRIRSHFAAGNTGFSGDTAPKRFARLMTWGGYGLARASDFGSPSPLLGPADSIDGSFTQQAIFTMSQTEGGNNYCDSMGNVTYRSRAVSYNRTPKWVFGDNPPVPLNQNPSFKGGSLAGWNPVGGSATIAPSQAQVFKDPWACLLTPDGVTSFCEVTATSLSQVRVDPAKRYKTTAWVYSPNGYGTVSIGTDWFTSVGGFILTSTVVFSVPAGQWTKLISGTLTPPGNAAFARPRVGEGGTPPGSANLFVQQLRFSFDSVEIPYDPAQSFGFDNSFLYNTGQVRRLASQSVQGVSVNLADPVSVKAYLQRFLPSISVETTSDQDAYDLLNWSLSRYSQPALRTIAIRIDPASYPDAWEAALGIEQGDIAQVIRRPLGTPAYSQTGPVQKISHEFGPGNWKTTISIAPYGPAGNVLVAGGSSFSAVGSNVLAW